MNDRTETAADLARDAEQKPKLKDIPEPTPADMKLNLRVWHQYLGERSVPIGHEKTGGFIRRAAKAEADAAALRAEVAKLREQLVATEAQEQATRDILQMTNATTERRGEQIKALRAALAAAQERERALRETISKCQDALESLDLSFDRVQSSEVTEKINNALDAAAALAADAAPPATEADAPPNWYSTDEMYDWLRRENYSEQIARELAALIATNYQLAFNKGFSMGKQSAPPASAEQRDDDAVSAAAWAAWAARRERETTWRRGGSGPGNMAIDEFCFREGFKIKIGEAEADAARRRLSLLAAVYSQVGFAAPSEPHQSLTPELRDRIRDELLGALK